MALLAHRGWLGLWLAGSLVAARPGQPGQGLRPLPRFPAAALLGALPEPDLRLGSGPDLRRLPAGPRWPEPLMIAVGGEDLPRRAARGVRLLGQLRVGLRMGLAPPPGSPP